MHISTCKNLGADLYIVSTAKKQEGLKTAMDFYRYASKKYVLPIMMSNSTGPTSRFNCVGHSAIWNEHGVLSQQLGAEDRDILFVDL